MDAANFSSEIIRFATYEVHPRAGEIRKAGVKLRLSEQPFQLLLALLERPGEVLTREELQKRLWPDTFVDVDGSLNAAINKIREVLGDSAENPRFVETVPRRGYRFMGPVVGTIAAPVKDGRRAELSRPGGGIGRRSFLLVAAALIVLLAGIAEWLALRSGVSRNPVQRTLTRTTFQPGLQHEATWSQDGRYIAYALSHDGKSDIWVQPLSGGDAVQLTHGPANDWQPDWSPDGKYIAYRSEDGNGGLYIIPATGRAEVRRQVASFGIYPRWSPDSRHLMFRTTWSALPNKIFVVDAEGGEPREIFAGITRDNWVMSASWHPDGKRITLWGWSLDPEPIRSFWTGPAYSEEAPVRTEVPAEIMKMAKDAAGPGTAAWADRDAAFQWAPSGDTIYFEKTFRGARNVFRLSVDRTTLRATGFERLTTGADDEAEFALSRDGNRLAFTSEPEEVRAWIFPFDATRGRLTGNGEPATSSGFEAWEGNLSRDGKKLAFVCNRGGKWELWQKSLVDGSEAPVAADDPYVRDEPQWSPDGTRLAYLRTNFQNRENKLIVWDSASHEELEVTGRSYNAMFVHDWSPDGNWLLGTVANPETQRAEIWRFPSSVRRSSGENQHHVVVPSDSKNDLWQAHYSPDGRWVVFEAIKGAPLHFESAIFVAPTSGGKWVRISDGKHWDDKPRWSPDGKSIYFLSENLGYFNVYRAPFDPTLGKATGDVAQITHFNNPSMMVGRSMSNVGFSVARDRLMITLSQRSGSIWILDNVNR
jgi:Tol biopolymer transport system component/DNA-binding winged helix-turn-helix (wHTH) protein